MVLLDAMNSFYISFSIAKKMVLEEKGREMEEDDLPFFFHVLFNKLNKIMTTYGQVVICNEGQRSLEWRRSIYPEYKRNRDASKTENTYKVFKSCLNKLDEVIQYFPVKWVKVDDTEADDVIFALSEKYHDKEEVTVISSDGDLAQIRLFFPNVRIYNPIKAVFVEPKKYLVESKAIVGDISDNIPGIPRIGQKTFEKMMEDPLLFREKIKEDNKIIYERFLQIVDLRKFPYKQKIIDEESKMGYNEFQPENIELFFYENRMKSLLDSWGRVRDDINVSLNKNKIG